MKRIILTYKDTAFVIVVAEDVNLHVTDILLSLEEKISYIEAIGDLSVDGSIRNWETPSGVRLGRKAMPYNSPGMKKNMFGLFEKSDRAFFSNHSLKWLKNARDRFVTLADVAPVLGTISTKVETGWSEKEVVVSCANCGTGILGKKRVKGDQAQKFQPKDKSVINIGKKWYCGCTSVKTIIPEIPKEIGSSSSEVYAEVEPSLRNDCVHYLYDILRRDIRTMTDEEVLAFRKVAVYLDFRDGGVK